MIWFLLGNWVGSAATILVMYRIWLHRMRMVSDAYYLLTSLAVQNFRLMHTPIFKAYAETMGSIRTQISVIPHESFRDE